jgi:hypothetical protein
MLNELTMPAPSNVVTIDQDSFEYVSFAGVIIKLPAAIKRFFTFELCLQIIAAAAVLNVAILLFVLNSLTIAGGASLTQIFAL